MSAVTSELHWLSSSPSVLLGAWLASLGFCILLTIAVCFIPRSFDRTKSFLFAALTFPSILMGILYVSGATAPWERPVVHWIFSRDLIDHLPLGVMFDPLSAVVVIFSGVTLGVICFLGRPDSRVSAAVTLAWTGLCLVVTSKTLWAVGIGIGIQLLSRFLPLLGEAGRSGSFVDRLWVSSSKRASLAILVLLAGAAGLASGGHSLVFGRGASWSGFEGNPVFFVSGAAFLFGLTLLASAVFSSPLLHDEKEDEGSPEAASGAAEKAFIFEAASGWSAVIVFYRILPDLRGTEWAMGVGAAAAVLLAFSVLAIVFMGRKSRAVHLWLAASPLLVLTILPFLGSHESFLWVSGSIIAFFGALLCFDHIGETVSRVFSGVFFLGMFGLVGWSTSSATLPFFSSIESEPVIVGSIALSWLLYACAGWRIVLLGGEGSPESRSPVRWSVSVLLILVGMGPLLSGRWSGGGIPEVSDVVESSFGWHWVSPFSELLRGEPSGTWVGFAFISSIIVLAVLIATFTGSRNELYSFSARHPKMREMVRGLFGLVAFGSALASALERMAERLGEVSSWYWERALPGVVRALFAGARRLGEVFERAADQITSEKFGTLFSTPAKFVQWIHGGSVRMYAWFALAWVLVFSIFLTL